MKFMVAAFSALLLCATLPLSAQNRLTLSLSHLQDKADETVDVNLDGPMLRMASAFLSEDDAEEKEVKLLVAGLKGIYVKSFSFTRDGAYTADDVNGIRSQLRGGWQRIVQVKSKDQDDVEIYTIPDGASLGGMVILSAGPRELTIVQLLGSIDMERLSKLQGQFGIPEIQVNAARGAK